MDKPTLHGKSINVSIGWWLGIATKPPTAVHITNAGVQHPHVYCPLTSSPLPHLKVAPQPRRGNPQPFPLLRVLLGAALGFTLMVASHNVLCSAIPRQQTCNAHNRWRSCWTDKSRIPHDKTVAHLPTHHVLYATPQQLRQSRATLHHQQQKQNSKSVAFAGTCPLRGTTPVSRSCSLAGSCNRHSEHVHPSKQLLPSTRWKPYGPRS